MLLATALAFCKSTKNKTSTMPHTGDYAKDWTAVDSLEQQGLPQSALAAADKIYEQAKRDNNSQQILKALIFKAKLVSQREEDAAEKAIQAMENELLTLPATEKSILHSMLGEAYAGYLQQRGWQIKQRTKLADGATGDIKTWTVADIENHAFGHYQKSVEQQDLLRAVPIEKYKDITLPGSGDTLTRPLRPTLFDFLAFRAIEFASNESNYLTEPEYKFELSQAEAFASAADFAKAKFENRGDSLSRKWLAIKMFQQILAIYQTDADPSNRVVADLHRLHFAHQNSTLDNKTALLEKALADLRQTAAKHPVEAEIMLAQAQNFQNQSQDGEQKTNRLPEVVKICREAIEKYPNSLGAKNCAVLLQQITRTDIGLEAENFVLPDRPALAAVRFQNLKKVWSKIVRYDFASRRFEQADEEDNDSKKFIQKLNALPAIAPREWNLNAPEDYRSHRTEIGLAGVPIGNYILLVSDNQEFNPESGQVVTANFTSTNLVVVNFQNENFENFVAAHRLTGLPTAGVELEFFRQFWDGSSYKTQSVGKATTDLNGFAKFDNAQNQGNQTMVQATLGEDKIWVGNFYRWEQGKPEVRREVKIFTDRAIYRPGQLVYFKAMALEFDQIGKPKILVGEKIDFSFRDANYQEKSRISLKTNEFGTCNGVFTAPAGGLTGSMSIQAEPISGGASFRVEEYKRPKFEVVFQPVTETFKLGQKVKIRGTAKNFSGAAVADAKVKFAVNRTASFPVWDWYFFRGIFPRSKNKQVANGEILTDAAGNFEIEFTAEPDFSIDKKLKPNFDFAVSADVTDISGETQSAAKTVSVGYVSLKIDLNLADVVELDSLHAVPLSVSNLAGEPQKVAGKIELTRLVEPAKNFTKRLWEAPDVWTISEADFRREFSNFAFKNEDSPERWGRQDFSKTLNFNTEAQKSVDLNAGTLAAGWYELRLTTRDVFGEEAELKQIFKVWSRQNPTSRFEEPQVTPTSWSGNPGDQITFDFGTPTGEANFFYAQKSIGNPLKTNWLKAKPTAGLPLQISEKDKGGVALTWFAVRDNRLFSGSRTVAVPWAESELKMSFETFRDKLLPGQDEVWKVKITGAKKEKVAAELVATMYDASLEQFSPHDVSRVEFPIFYNALNFEADQQFRSADGQVFDFREGRYLSGGERSFRVLNWFGFPLFGNRYGREVYLMSATSAGGRPRAKMKNQVAEENMAMDALAEVADAAAAPQAEATAPSGGGNAGKTAPPAVRKNLNELVFFLPELRTDAEGNVILKFKMNEALTRWKFLAFAHTKEMATGVLRSEVVTQKELMIQANPPRFLREGDEVEFSAKISNLSSGEISGNAALSLRDALTDTLISENFNLFDGLEQLENKIDIGNGQFFSPPKISKWSFDKKEFKIEAGGSTAVFWKLKVPAGKTDAVIWQVRAEGASHSDGEENALPVLTNRMLVTETIPLAVRGNQSKTFDFQSLAASQSSTRQAHRYTLEFSSNPVWYAVQALPYLMEYPHECSEQVFSRFYANALAQNITSKLPQIRRVFDRWKGSPDALKSNLSKNQDLKSALLEETPWVLQAQSEEQQKQNIALLFDLNRMANERERALEILKSRQNADGGWSWFPGSPSSEYITSYILSGFGHLEKLGAISVQNDQNLGQMVAAAQNFSKNAVAKKYHELEKLVQEGKAKWTDDHLGSVIFDLYAQSFFGLEKDKITNFYLGQAEKFWLGKGLYQEGLLALILQRTGNYTAAQKIVASLRERALTSDELGMYWKTDWGFYWHQLPIETQSLMVEVFDEVAGDRAAVENLRIWLLKNKQTNRWASTKATAEAVTALLLHGDNWLENSRPVRIELGKNLVKPSEIEAGTGYFKNVWAGEQVKPDFSKIKVQNPNSNIVWGAAYFQYFEDLDKIKDFQKTPLTIVKQYFKEEQTAAGKKLVPISEQTPLKTGDRLKVRIEIRVDRAMEFVHLKDLRPAGTEPTNVLSGYRWKDGLGYYESTKDLATHFFIDYLPRGTFVFEYALVTNLRGSFSTGITTIQSMYAPEFSSHSRGERILIR